MIHIVTYDLHQPQRDYDAIEDAIKALGSWAHVEESVWLVDTDLTAGQCRQRLTEVTTQATYFVARLTGTWSSWSIPNAVAEWLKSSNRDW